MKQCIRFPVCFILAALGFGLLSAPTHQSAASLKEMFGRYIKSVQSSDLEGLFQTVTDNEKFFSRFRVLSG
jgi:hypothetical protein